MWTYGYTDHFDPEGTKDTDFGYSEDFTVALSELRDNVEKMAVDADKYEEDWFDQIISDIDLILHDPGITEDPDQWEDQEFYALDGAITFYLIDL
jgi:hypothetical protein